MTRTMTERQWQHEVIDLARRGGWTVFHAYEPQRVLRGWPDLFLIRVPSIVVAELKTNGGKLTEDQTYLLDKFIRCGIETYVWRPRDYEVVRERLRARSSDLT